MPERRLVVNQEDQSRSEAAHSVKRGNGTFPLCSQRLRARDVRRTRIRMECLYLRHARSFIVAFFLLRA